MGMYIIKYKGSQQNKDRTLFLLKINKGFRKENTRTLLWEVLGTVLKMSCSTKAVPFRLQNFRWQVFILKIKVLDKQNLK